MIGYLEGTRTHTLTDSVLLLTPGGVGYQIFVPAPLLARQTSVDVVERYFVSTVVRDNEIALYGFADAEAKRTFEALLKVNGVGPKVGLALLSAFTPEELATAVAAEDAALLASIPGIGKKTATRICLDLKDRLGPGIAAPTAGPQQDLVSALTNLGYPEKQVFAAVRQLPPDVSAFQERLKQALALLAKR